MTFTLMDKKRPEDASINRGEMLVADFLLANKAVVDFGSSILYPKMQM